MIVRRLDFTLPEVIAVMVILGLLASLAVPMLRSPDPFERIRQAALEFEAFCARGRFQAVEQGRDAVLCFDLERKRFYFRDPDADDLFSGEPGPSRSWKLPDDFEFDESHAEGDELEIFRFFPDGGASGMRSLVFRCGSAAYRFEISPLTGSLSGREAREEEELP